MRVGGCCLRLTAGFVPFTVTLHIAYATSFQRFNACYATWAGAARHRSTTIYAREISSGSCVSGICITARDLSLMCLSFLSLSLSRFDAPSKVDLQTTVHARYLFPLQYLQEVPSPSRNVHIT